MKIPLGQQGNAVAAPVGGPGVPVGAFVEPNSNLGAHIADTAAQFQDVTLRQAERDAIFEATTGIIAAKSKRDEWTVAQAASAVDENGNPRFGSMLKDYDTLGQKVLQESLKGVTSPRAKQVMQKDIQSYWQSGRDTVLKLADKQKQDYQGAALADLLDTIKTDTNIDDAERDKRFKQALGAGLQIGAITAEAAQKALKGYEQDAEFGRVFTRIQSAVTHDELVEMRGQLAQANRRLSPEKNVQLVNILNERMTQLDRQADASVRAQQDNIEKNFVKRAADGTLTLKDIEAAQGQASAATFAKFYAMYQGQQKTAAEGGIDDPDKYRNLEREIVLNSRDPAKLEALRRQVLNEMTGWNEATKSGGHKPSLSRSSGQALIDKAERYQAEFRSEQRQIKGDAQVQERGALAIVKQEIEAKFDAAAASRYGPKAQGEIKARKADALIAAEKAGKDLAGWFEKFKADKVNADVFGGKQVSFPSWAVLNGTAFDANATRARLKQDYDRRTINQAEFQRRMDEIKRLENGQ